MARIVSIGECMLELSRGMPGGRVWRLQHGGDTLNTAVYLARLGENVAYLTALGADPFSRSMREGWADEGIDTSLILTDPARLPGLYLIETDSAGERSFHYWREQSAARTLFDCDGVDGVLDRAGGAELLYLSGITLSLFDAARRRRLIALCEQVRAKGGQVAFDPNYRPRGWESPETARAAIADLAPHVTIALPTFEDDALLYGDPSPEFSWRRWRRAGVAEVVIKLGPRGALVSEGDRLVSVPAVADPAPRDTTGAGDAFNAAYLVARRRGLGGATAAAAGNKLAGAVVRQPGAIVPGATMPFGMKSDLARSSAA